MIKQFRKKKRSLTAGGSVAMKVKIAIVNREESCTSKASLLDLDDIPTYKKGSLFLYNRYKYLKGVNMIKELIKIKENNNIVSIFCDEDDTSMFLEDIFTQLEDKIF